MCKKCEAVIAKCKEEVQWAQDNIDEMNKNGGYNDEDKVWLPCFLKVHQEILSIIEKGI